MRWLWCATLFVGFYAVCAALEMAAVNASLPDFVEYRPSVWQAATFSATWRGAVIVPLALLGFLIPGTRRGIASRKLVIAVAIVVTLLVFLATNLLAMGQFSFDFAYYEPKTSVPMALGALVDVFTAAAIFWVTIGVDAPRRTAAAVRTVDLTPMVRALDRMNYWRAGYRSAVASWTFIPILLAAAFLVLTYGFGWRLPQPPWWWRFVLVGLLGLPVVAVTLSILGSFLHWRAVALLALLTASPTIVAMNPVIESLAQQFGDVDRAFVVFWAVSLPLFLLVVGLNTAVAMTSNEALNIARGWRPTSIGGRIRQAYGVPVYVSGAAPASFGIAALFVLASIFYALWQILPFAVVNSASQFASIVLVMIEQGLSAAEIVVQASVGGVLGTLLLLAVVGGFALIGNAFARRGRRAITERYQSALERDGRPPVLYLRAFNIDQLKLRSRRHGVLPRLVNAPGAPATLDEIILDRVSPYAPVVAIGKPNEPTPPLGAARVYVQGDDWQSVVRSLANAGQLVILTLDRTPGVRWEIDFLLHGEHANKALFLANPNETREERWRQVQALFPDCEKQSACDVIGVAKRNGVTTVLTGPHAGREAYGCAVGWCLRESELAGPH